MVEYMKEQFISELHLKKKNITQRKSIINKREENKEEFAKDRTWKFVGTSDSKCL